MSDEKLKDKISPEDKEVIEKKCDEVVAWLETHQDAATEDFAAKQKDVESVVNPIMTKV